MSLPCEALVPWKRTTNGNLKFNSLSASAIPFARRNAKIIWSDIDFKTRVSDINDIKKKITRKTKAIVIVHLYGYHCDLGKL